MPTTRERLESAVADLRKMSAAVEATKGRAAADDLDALERQGTLVQALVEELKGSDLVASLSQPASSPFAGVSASELSTPGNGAPRAAKSLGAPPLAFSKESLEALQKGALDRHIVTKDAITATDSPMSAVGNYSFDVFPYLRDRVRILDLIPTIPTTAPKEFYFRATAAASAADTVAAGADKPYSEPHWEQVDATVEKIAHYTRVNDEVIADFTSFLDVIGREMIAGLIDAENAQLLSGSGTPPDLEGLLVNADVTSIGSAGTDLDAVATAANTVRTLAFVEPDTVVMHPNDWASTGFLLAKDSSGQYLVGNPVSATAPSLWGMKVVLTTRMTENTLLVANLKEAARVYVRQAPTLEVQPGGGTAEFIANQTLIRAEERLALAIVRPLAACKVTAV